MRWLDRGHVMRGGNSILANIETEQKTNEQSAMAATFVCAQVALGSDVGTVGQ